MLKDNIKWASCNSNVPWSCQRSRSKSKSKNNGRVTKARPFRLQELCRRKNFEVPRWKKVVLFLYLGRVSGKTLKGPSSCLWAKHTNKTRGEKINATDSRHLNSLEACNLRLLLATRKISDWSGNTKTYCHYCVGVAQYKKRIRIRFFGTGRNYDLLSSLQRMKRWDHSCFVKLIKTIIGCFGSWW